MNSGSRSKGFPSVVRSEAIAREMTMTEAYEMKNVSPGVRLAQLARSERREIRLVVAYGIFVGVLSLVVPVTAQAVVNTVAFASLPQPILILSILVLVIMGTANILRLFQVSVVESIQQRIFARTAVDLAYRFVNVRIDAYDTRRGTELANRFFEVMAVQKSSSLMLLDGLTVVIQAVIGLVLLGFYHPILLAFDVLLVACMALVIFWPLSRGVKTSLAESQAKYSVAGWLEEIARNPLAFKFMSGPRHALQRADDAVYSYVQDRSSHFRVLSRQIAGTLIIQAVVSALLLGIGGILVIRGQLTLGQLVAAEIVVTMVVSGFAKFGKYFEAGYDLAAAVDKLGYLADLPLEEGGEGTPTWTPGAPAVRMHGVSFRYDDNALPSLKEIDLFIRVGEKVGILGVNGSGKTSLIDLMVGLRPPEQGSVEIGSWDAKSIDREKARAEIALVRGPDIFEGTIEANLRVGREDITSEEIRHALEVVGLWEDLLKLPEGLGTRLGGARNPISAGQAQRLVLARAIVATPKLLVLDEAFESIESIAKSAILAELSRPDRPWTLIVASHDPADVIHCDRVYEIRGGTVTEMQGGDA